MWPPNRLRSQVLVHFLHLPATPTGTSCRWTINRPTLLFDLMPRSEYFQCAYRLNGDCRCVCVRV